MSRNTRYTFENINKKKHRNTNRPFQQKNEEKN